MVLTPNAADTFTISQDCLLCWKSCDGLFPTKLVLLLPMGRPFNPQERRGLQLYCQQHEHFFKSVKTMEVLCEWRPGITEEFTLHLDAVNDALLCFAYDAGMRVECFTLRVRNGFNDMTILADDIDCATFARRLRRCSGNLKAFHFEGSFSENGTMHEFALEDLVSNITDKWVQNCAVPCCEQRTGIPMGTEITILSNNMLDFVPVEALRNLCQLKLTGRLTVACATAGTLAKFVDAASQAVGVGGGTLEVKVNIGRPLCRLLLENTFFGMIVVSSLDDTQVPGRDTCALFAAACKSTTKKVRMNFATGAINKGDITRCCLRAASLVELNFYLTELEWPTGLVLEDYVCLAVNTCLDLNRAGRNRIERPSPNPVRVGLLDFTAVPDPTNRRSRRIPVDLTEPQTEDFYSVLSQLVTVPAIFHVLILNPSVVGRPPSRFRRS